MAERLFGENAPDWRVAQLALAYGQLGRSDEVDRLYRRLEGMDSVGHAAWAMADIARGDYGKAQEHLRAVPRTSDEGGTIPLVGELRANVYGDPALESTAFRSLLDDLVAAD